MDWQSFLKYVKAKEPSPVLSSVLVNTQLVSINGATTTISHINGGGKIFLDGRKALIEGHLSSFLKKPIRVEVVVVEKKKKKGARAQTTQGDLPLMEYKNNFELVLKKAHIQERFTFENFAVSSSNHIAHAAAQAVAENIGTMYNPLFIYGSVGVGKTHLSQAIANRALGKNPQKKVLYCTSEQFTNDLVEFIRLRNTKELRKKYRELDILIIDDVQFIAGKNYVQEEFYHTFNTIVQGRGQVVLISDRPPKEIKELEDRLRSRFSGGLILDIQKPDFELRTAIVLIKADERHIDIDIDAAKEIAEKITDSRELEGTLLRLLSTTLLASQSNKITVETTRGGFSYQAALSSQSMSPHGVIKNVCIYYHLKPSLIKSETRKQNIALVRHIIMYILRKKLEINLDEIAFILKRKDHTTIMYGVEKIQEKILSDERFKEEINKVVAFSLST